MGKIFTRIMIIISAIAAPTAADAQSVLLGPQIAYHGDFDVGVGGVAHIPVRRLHENLELGLGVATFFPEREGHEAFRATVDLVRTLPLRGQRVLPFVSIGASASRITIRDDGASEEFRDTEVGLGLGGGMRFGTGLIRPQIGMRLELDGVFVVSASVPFALGR